MSDIDQIVEDVKSGKLEFHRIEERLNPNAAVVARRLALEKVLGVGLPSIGSSVVDFEEIHRKNIENPIGAVQIPLGVAGPIKVQGNYAVGNFYVPMATTEGALVASVNRGMKALSLSGGVTVRVIRDGMARAPVLTFTSILEVEEFLTWLGNNLDRIKSVAESTTSHGKLDSVTPFVMGNNVWIRLVYKTGDAMGMNMATIASEKVCDFIEREFPKARCVAVSGNMCSDKKQSHVNSLFGRGKTVVGEAVVREEVLRDVLRTTASSVHDVNLRKNWLGSARAGSMQYNAHFANVVTAVFIATGQDVAQVVESSSGYTWTEVRGNSLYISVTLTSLEVGTVGGGTSLPTQREALSIMGVQGSGNPPGSNSLKFAEILTSAVLAGELNLLAALSTRELGKAHKALGRNVKV